MKLKARRQCLLLDPVFAHKLSDSQPIGSIMLQNPETVFLYIKCTRRNLAKKLNLFIPLSFVFDKFDVSILSFQGSGRQEEKKQAYRKCTVQFSFYQFNKNHRLIV